MTRKKPQTRTEATAPVATRHLNADQLKALDVQADAEHTDGRLREKLTREMAKRGGLKEATGG